ncbi:MAG: 5-formyltetrahydrofolate cyclo-ligase [Candidatus Desulfofervidaceae bacterium]|nr:5-formyltetrahydrofolate cyclo-ligase [Candidatus Desulfofervidaceae bacterium]
MVNTKQSLRNQIWQLLWGKKVSPAPFQRIPPFAGQNKAAERLRHLPAYKKAKCIMVPPDEAQRQVRFNALVDRKRLIIATPGLQDGFYVLDPKHLPRRYWPTAIQTYGVIDYGRKLPTQKGSIGHIDLLATGAVAVSKNGGRLGKGAGFFDLEYAILREIGCIDSQTAVVALVHDLQIVESLPITDKDVPVDYIVTPTRIIQTETLFPKPEGIPWEHLNPKQIRRMRPLWELKKKQSA